MSSVEDLIRNVVHHNSEWNGDRAERLWMEANRRRHCPEPRRRRRSVHRVFAMATFTTLLVSGVALGASASLREFVGLSGPAQDQIGAIREPASISPLPAAISDESVPLASPAEMERLTNAWAHEPDGMNRDYGQAGVSTSARVLVDTNHRGVQLRMLVVPTDRGGVCHELFVRRDGLVAGSVGGCISEFTEKRPMTETSFVDEGEFIIAGLVANEIERVHLVMPNGDRVTAPLGRNAYAYNTAASDPQPVAVEGVVSDGRIITLQRDLHSAAPASVS